MKRLFIYLFTIFGLSFIFVEKALAICPLCTIAVAAGIGFSRWVGVDDSITGLWIGGLTVSLIIWTISWLGKKNINFRGRTILTTLGYYLLIVVPLYFLGIMGNPLNTLYIYGVLIDKLLLGIIAGSAGFYFSVSWYNYLKEKNQSRAHFPFQKIAMPVGVLIILSVIFYFLTK